MVYGFWNFIFFVMTLKLKQFHLLFVRGEAIYGIMRTIMICHHNHDSDVTSLRS